MVSNRTLSLTILYLRSSSSPTVLFPRASKNPLRLQAMTNSLSLYLSLMLCVETVLSLSGSTALGVLYSTHLSNPAGPSGFSYNRSDAASVYWEVIRLFPPARAVPYWGRRPLCPGLNRTQTDSLNRPDGRTASCPLGGVDDATGYSRVNQYRGGFRTLINLATAMSDPAVWGGDAKLFRPRRLRKYNEHSVGFAEPAVDEAVRNGAMNRNCPARSLALLAGTTFLELFEKREWFVPQDAGKEIVMKPGDRADTTFTVYYRYNETNCRQVLCKCGPKQSGEKVCGPQERECEKCLKANKSCRF